MLVYALFSDESAQIASLQTRRDTNTPSRRFIFGLSEFSRIGEPEETSAVYRDSEREGKQKP